MNVIDYYDLYSIIKDNKERLVILNFTASWATQCKEQKVILNKFLENHEDVLLINIDIDQNHGLYEKIYKDKLFCVPTFQIYSPGETLPSKRERLTPLESLEKIYHEASKS